MQNEPHLLSRAAIWPSANAAPLHIMIHLITDSAGGVTPTPERFPLGRIVATLGALAAIPGAEMEAAIHRHHSGDWGDVSKNDHDENERSLRDGSRLFSVYHTKAGVKFYIITEQDRSVTTILLPDEY